MLGKVKRRNICVSKRISFELQETPNLQYEVFCYFLIKLALRASSITIIPKRFLTVSIYVRPRG